MIHKWFIFPLYLIRYDLRIIEDSNNWYSHKYKKWVNLNCDGNLFSSLCFKNKRKAFKEFNDLTKQGIKCVLNDRKIILGKGWYLVNEWYSEDQKYFNINKVK